MARWLTGGVLGVGLAALLIGDVEFVRAQKQKAAAKGWLNNYAAARAAARQTRKPIFLVFR